MFFAATQYLWSDKLTRRQPLLDSPVLDVAAPGRSMWWQRVLWWFFLLYNQPNFAC